MIHTVLVSSAIVLAFLLCIMAFSGIKFYAIVTGKPKDALFLKILTVTLSAFLIACIIGTYFFIAV